MPAEVLTTVRLFVDGREMSGQMNAVGLEYGVDALDATVYGENTRIHAGGLKNTTMSHQGYWAAADDAHIFARVGPSAVATICPTSAASGELAYFEKVMHATYNVGGAVGELLPFSFDAEAAGPLVRGAVLKDPVQVTGNGTGTAYQLGALAAGQKLVAALHVVQITGGTLTVVVQSDDDVGFPSPISQITFTGVTVPGAQILEVAGPVTDDWWRANWTLTGGSATFILSAGII
jgi:hypothetical protein